MCIFFYIPSKVSFKFYLRLWSSSTVRLSTSSSVVWTKRFAPLGTRNAPNPFLCFLLPASVLLLPFLPPFLNVKLFALDGRCDQAPRGVCCGGGISSSSLSMVVALPRLLLLLPSSELFGDGEDSVTVDTEVSEFVGDTAALLLPSDFISLLFSSSFVVVVAACCSSSFLEYANAAFSERC